MKLIITALILTALGGCTLYTARDGTYASEFDARECRHEAAQAPEIRMCPHFSGPGGMECSAKRYDELTTSCMARLGYKPAGSV